MATKQKHSAWCAVLTALLFAMVFNGCGNGGDASTVVRAVGGEVRELCPEIERRIKQDYINQCEDHLRANASVDDVIIQSYFGTYNGSVVVAFSSKIVDGLGMMWEEIVAGFTFSRGSISFPIIVWHDGTFYSLTSAYKQGFLTQEHLEKIHTLNSKGW